MRLVQLVRRRERRVGWVNGGELRLCDARQGSDIYSLALKAAAKGQKLSVTVEDAMGDETLQYAPIHQGASEWRLLPSFDHPYDAARLMVSGTGLTHKASAQNRAAMHARQPSEITDSSRMYEMGLEGGSPRAGEIGCNRNGFSKAMVRFSVRMTKSWKFPHMETMEARNRRSPAYM